uniref:DNA-directed DNA polymerase n=1 Tax=Tanacetum cinerariifolium TaxID=118510 RepID=A0A6L2J4V9_TANCI|nr:DNA-directed DNA polymerase [Tanacetum cinerariifolium]
MADTHTMSELLQAPTEGYKDAIVIPTILAENFEFKVGLLSLVTSSQFHGFERDDPHSHIPWFNKITSTLKYKNVPHDAIKLMLFLFSLEGAVQTWLEKEPPHSLNAAAGGNLLNRTPRDALTIIENKSKVRTSRNKPVVSKVNTTTSSTSPSADVTALIEIVKELLLNVKATQQATVKAIEETCVTCGRPHPYYEYLATGGNTFNACAAVGPYNQGDALLHMPKFASTFKSLLSNKEKLFELASTSLNENCLAVLLKKLPKKLEDPGKFLKLLLLELSPTRMTLELANRSVAYPVGVAKGVFVKVGKFYFPADFVVVNYDVDPRVSLILGRPFLRTARALIDVHGEELTLRVNDVAITFKVGHTSRYSNSSTSGNPTSSDPIIASSSPSFTPFEGSDFILEEIETSLRTPNELSTLDDDFDMEGDIALIEKLLNEDPSPNLPPMKNKDLKQADVNMMKPSIEEPPELKLKDLPSHLEYAFLEGTDKLPVIISKELKDE